MRYMTWGTMRTDCRGGAYPIVPLVLSLAAIASACQETPTSPPAGFVMLGPALLNPLEVGDSLVVTATGFSSAGSGPYSLGSPRWSSDDPMIASIRPLANQSIFGEQARAQVVGLSPGTTTIRVDTRAGQASMEVPVVAASPGS